MSYQPDTIQAKLSSLNETQDAIVGVAQWLSFHKRWAPQIAELWLQKIKQTHPSKRLSFVYLVNEITQQAKIRKRFEFRDAFGPVLVEALAAAYKSASLEIQQKLRRTVDVWREREIFETQVLDEIEVALNEIDLARASTRKAIGGSIFSSTSSMPPVLQPILTAQNTLNSAESKASEALSDFDTSDKKNAISNGSTADSISPETLAPLSADLSSLLQKLSAASVTVAATIDAREILLKALTKLTDETRTALKEDNRRFDELNAKKERLDNEHKRIEERIERGDGQNGISYGGLEPERPDMEPLTPPPVETLTPPGNPVDDEDEDDEHLYSPPGASASGKSASNIRVASDSSLQGQSPIKKRRLESHDEFAAFADGAALGGLDPDVEAMLNG